MNQDEKFQIMNKGTDFVTVTLASEDAETETPRCASTLRPGDFRELLLVRQVSFGLYSQFGHGEKN